MAISQNECFANAVTQTIRCDRLRGPARSQCYAQAYRNMRKCYRQAGGRVTQIQLGPVKTIARLLLQANGAERRRLVKAIVLGATLARSFTTKSK